MAKTFGTGADPKGLVNRGVEGSGAAQIFRPSQAIQDFVTGQRQQGLQKQKQKQAEAKAKAERQKNLDSQFQDLLKIDLKGWTEPDNQMILGEYNNVLTEAAKLKAQGINPSDDLDFSTKVAQLKLNVGALQDQKKLWELANTKAYTMANNKQLDEEAFNNYTENITAWQQLSLADRNANIALLEPPKVQVPIDWFKNKQQLIKGTKYKVEEIEIGGLGEKTEITEKVTKDTIDANWNSYMASPNYKQEVKDYQKTFNVSEEEAGNMAKADYVAALPTKYRQKYDADKGGVNINYGDGKITSYYTEAFFSPESYNNLKDRVPELGIFSPAAAMQISDEGAIMFKGRKGKEPPPMLIPNADGTTSPFKINAIFKKKDGNYTAVGIRGIYDENGRFLPNAKSTININEYNKRDVEETYLGGIEIEKAFENFKANRNSAQPTAPKTNKKPKPY